MAYGATQALPTTHQPGYIYIPVSMANAGDTGLTTSTAYLCFKHTDIKDVTNFTPTEADEVNGDYRKICQYMAEAMYADWNAIASADRPDNITVTKSSLVETSTAGESQFTISFKFIVDTSALEVAAE